MRLVIDAAATKKAMSTMLRPVSDGADITLVFEDLTYTTDQCVDLALALLLDRPYTEVTVVGDGPQQDAFRGAAIRMGAGRRIR